MSTLSTSRYILEPINEEEFRIFRRNYMPIVTNIEIGTFTVNQEIIKGINKKPHSGYWDEAVHQIVNGEGKIFEKYNK